MECEWDDSSTQIDIEIEEVFNYSCESLIPTKSKERYETVYRSFKKWLDAEKANINEKTMLAYFVQRNKILTSPRSLWSEYSMLKATINLHDNVQISVFKNVIAFLKKQNIGYRPKKTKTFTREDMKRFLNEAPDEMYLMMKVVMIVGISGACRCEEIVRLTIDDIEDRGSVIIVTIPTSKPKNVRTFTIINNTIEEVYFLDIFRKYERLRPQNASSRRFFIGYRQGQCVNQVVGLHTIGKIPSNIAQFLKLKDPHLYTGHVFRRSANLIGR